MIIRWARKKRRMSLGEVAQASNVSEPTIRRAEAGDSRVKPETMAQIAKAVGLGFDWPTSSVCRPLGVADEEIEAAARRRSEELQQRYRRVCRTGDETRSLRGSGRKDVGCEVGRSSISATASAAARTSGAASLAQMTWDGPTIFTMESGMGASLNSI
jgi:transcriptional regulator with XRE-family HTH domain